MSYFTWTPEQCERLRILWDEGYSASMIADLIGAVSRNAVLGKVHRLKLPKRIVRRTRPSGAPPKASRPRLPRAARKAHRIMPRRSSMPRQVEPTIAPEPVVFSASAWQPLPGSNPVTLEHLTGCKWPVSDPFAPRGSVALFCNCETVRDKPYCREHAARSVGQGTSFERGAEKSAKIAVHVERLAEAA